jgi:hypothetical protein
MADPKDEAFNKAVADAVAKAMETVIPASIGAAIQVSQPKGAVRPSTDICGECRQYLRACKGEHEQMEVWCHDPEVNRWFTGVRINGVTYLSPEAGIRVTVPKGSDIASIISAYSQGEKEMMRGKKVQHDSGSLNSFRPATGLR